MPKMPNSPSPSGRDDWTTPDDFYARLDREFGFCLDAAADASNFRAAGYLIDALSDAWHIGPIFCNPPYGRLATPLWLNRGITEFNRTGNTTVFLLPAATETKWFHELAVPNAAEIRLIKGRLKFGNALYKDGTVGEASAPFPSAVVILRNAPSLRIFGSKTSAYISAWDWRKE